jgi:hypothetical protein
MRISPKLGESSLKETLRVGLARSSFYYKPKGKSPEQMKVETDLRDRIDTICCELPRYGYRRVTKQL